MNRLEEMYEEMVRMTKPSCDGVIGECSEFRGKRYRCCSLGYCERAREFARESYGVELKETGNRELLYMGENGCTVEPKFRPLCSLHVCSITWGNRSMVGGGVETSEYFELRERILEEEKRLGHKII